MQVEWDFTGEEGMKQDYLNKEDAIKLGHKILMLKGAADDWPDGWTEALDAYAGIFRDIRKLREHAAWCEGRDAAAKRIAEYFAPGSEVLQESLVKAVRDLRSPYETEKDGAP